MVTKTLRGLLASGAAITTLALSAQAFAGEVAIFDPSDFYVVESAGQYTLYNNSTDWYVYAFGVTNPEAQYGYAYTNQDGWEGGTSFCGSGCGVGDFSGPFFSYFNTYYSRDEGILDKSIGPGDHSNQFFFGGAAASTYMINIVNIDNQTDVVYGPAQSAAPEPASWALMLAGFGLLGGALRGRRHRTVTA